MSHAITAKDPQLPQYIDLIPNEMVQEVFQFLDGYSLFNLSRVSTKWYAWVITYAPRRLLRDYPEIHKPDISGQQALAYLASFSRVPHNLANGIFQHTFIRIPQFRPCGTITGIRGHSLIATRQIQNLFGHFVISSRTGAIQRVFETGPRDDSTFFLNGLLWGYKQNFLEAWNRTSGVLKHKIPLPAGRVFDIDSTEAGDFMLSIEGNGAHYVGLLDLKTDRVQRRLLPPAPGSIPVFMRSKYPDVHLRQPPHFIKVLWDSTFGPFGTELRLATYSLESAEPESLEPIEARTIHPQLQCRLLGRYERYRVRLVYTDEGNWRILNLQGDSVFPKPIHNLACSDHMLILLVADENRYSFQAYDLALQKVIWTCPLEGQLSTIILQDGIMKFVSPERVFLFAKGLYVLLDLPSKSIVKSYQIQDLSLDDEEDVQFDGEQILQFSKSGLHILDFTYLQEGPRRDTTLTCSNAFQYAPRPAVGQNYHLQPHQIINLST